MLFLPPLVIAFIAYPIFSILEIDRIQEDLRKWTWELKPFDLPLGTQFFWYVTIGFGLLMLIVDLSEGERSFWVSKAKSLMDNSVFFNCSFYDLRDK